MDTWVLGAFLLIALLVLLFAGVWIAMALAIVGWIGQQFFTTTQPGKNLFFGLLGKQCELGTRRLTAVYLDGRNPI